MSNVLFKAEVQRLAWKLVNVAETPVQCCDVEEAICKLPIDLDDLDKMICALSYKRREWYRVNGR